MLLLLGVWRLWEVLDFVVKAAMPVPSEWETVSEPRWRRSRICVGGLVVGLTLFWVEGRTRRQARTGPSITLSGILIAEIT
jgi:hypothetical protein